VTAPHKLTLDDLWSLQYMGNIAVSPDGRRVAFVMHSTDKDQNEGHSVIFLLHLDEQGHAVGEPRRLTSGTKHDSNPIWAPDSKRLLFLSNREGDKNQLWLIDTDGGEARKLTNMQHGVNEAAWSPDGQWIAFTASAAPSDDDDVLAGRKSLDEAAKKKYEEEERLRLRTVTKIFYRVDGGGLFEKFAQLFVMPAPTTDSGPVDPAKIRRLTNGDFGHSQPSWTPDSLEISVLCNRNDNRDRSFASDLWAIDRETAEARCLTEGDLEITCYSWSPDGHSVVVVGAKDQTVHGRSIQRLYLVPRRGNGGNQIISLSSDFDLATFPVAGGNWGFPDPYRPQWSQDGQQIYFLATERSRVHVYTIDIASRSISQLTSGDSLTTFLALLPGERGFLLAQERPDHPWELYHLPLTDTGAGVLERLTHLYDQFMSERLWGKFEHIRYQGVNGDEIDGWLIHPIGARGGVRYPLMVHIHGGPHWAFGIGVDPVYHHFAAQGYAIFYCNPHGSTGRGEAFMRQVLGDWGGWDFQDIMLGVNECIARGVADPERMVVTGYSYGGFMSMFIIGHTNRFKAAVPMAGISNLTTFVGTSDIGFWQVAQAKGYPWDPERADYYRERSPLSSAHRVTTPTLFLHPENDLRCPIEQSEQFYMTLKMMGKVPVEFVRAPAAWHIGTTKPSQFLSYWQKMLEWFGKYVEIRSDEYE